MAPNVLVEYKHDIKQLKSIMKIKGFQSKIYLHTTTNSNKEYWTEDNKKNVFYPKYCHKEKIYTWFNYYGLKNKTEECYKKWKSINNTKGSH